jgi:hypothetical protein
MRLTNYARRTKERAVKTWRLLTALKDVNPMSSNGPEVIKVIGNGRSYLAILRIIIIGQYHSARHNISRIESKHQISLFGWVQ